MSNSKGNNLPEYTSSPVTEVALGVQFEPLLGLDSIEIGRLSASFSEEFPTHLEQPPLPHVVSVDLSIPANIQIGLIQQPRRYWFLSHMTDMLLQLQNDRVILNWRKVNDDLVYPRYNALKKLFEGKFNVIDQFVSSKGLGKIKIDMVDLEYTNLIETNSNGPIQLEKIVHFWKSFDSDCLGNPESFNIDLQFDLQKEKSSFAKMTILLRPFLSADRALKLFMKMRVLAIPRTENFESALELLDEVHGDIVKNFDELTLGEMHEKWGKII